MLYLLPSKALLVITTNFISIQITACTKKPSQADYTILEEATKAANAAEEQVILLKSELSQLQADLDKEKQKLSENISEKNFIQGKLGK